MRLKNLLSIQDLSRDEILEICILAGQRYRNLSDTKVSPSKGSAIGLVFLEASTRTRSSFERAAQLLGRPTILIEAKGSSVEKGESLHDTVLTLNSVEVGAFVIRSPVSNSLQALTSLGVGPIINAGDGTNEHPTQALADLATLLEFALSQKVTGIQGFRMGIVGDLRHSRVARSWSRLAPLVGIELKFLSPPAWKLDEQSWTSERSGFLDSLDAVMALRVQKERIEGLSDSNLTSFAQSYQFRDSDLRSDQWLLHPGPTNWGVELDPSLLDHPRTLIRKQVRMGLAVRSVLLEMIA